MLTQEIYEKATEKMLNKHKKGDEIAFYMIYSYIDEQTTSKERLDFTDIMIMRAIAKTKWQVILDFQNDKNVLIYK